MKHSRSCRLRIGDCVTACLSFMAARSRASFALAGVLLATGIGRLSACDEGMWLFNNLPTAHLAEQYGFEPDAAWVDHLMKASVRFNSGGSGSFVSSDGLVLTNQHVGSDTLQKLSNAQRNLLLEGFLAKDRSQEEPAPDLELNQLISISPVSERVNNAIADNMSAADAAAARRAVIAEIEQEAREKSGNYCSVVTLYGGGQYHLYEYKRYTDVRLVWAPEQAAAQFGGDADNFEFPRYCLDACIFRVYEDDQPARIEHYLRWNDDGPAEGELVFVSGNPGNTSRIYTTAALKYERDVRMPDVLNYIRRREILLQQYSLEGPEQKRRAADELMSYQNSRKAYTGMLAGLQNPTYMSQLMNREQELLQKIAADPQLADLASAWEEIRDVQQKRARLRRQAFTLNTRLYGIARTLVQLAAEDEKPNTARLPEYRDSNRESLMQGLLSEASIYSDLERVKLADLIARTVEVRGADDAMCQMMLNGKSPRERADELICNTKLVDNNVRQQLAEGGTQAIRSSDDPLIVFAASLDPEERRLRAEDEELDEIERQAYARISRALFAIRGTSVYPDATFTLRLAYGVVKGYEEDGKTIPPWTTMGEAFQHQLEHDNREPWLLPASWMAARERLPAATPLDFVCTADIIGGNSGSPVVNRKLELVGLIFDGNIQSLTSDFFYSDCRARAVSVNAGAIRAALRYVYQAEFLADQLGH